MHKVKRSELPAFLVRRARALLAQLGKDVNGYIIAIDTDEGEDSWVNANIGDPSQDSEAKIIDGPHGTFLFAGDPELNPEDQVFIVEDNGELYLADNSYCSEMYNVVIRKTETIDLTATATVKRIPSKDALAYLQERRVARAKEQGLDTEAYMLCIADKDGPIAYEGVRGTLECVRVHPLWEHLYGTNCKQSVCELGEEGQLTLVPGHEDATVKVECYVEIVPVARTRIHLPLI